MEFDREPITNLFYTSLIFGASSSGKDAARGAHHPANVPKADHSGGAMLAAESVMLVSIDTLIAV